MACREYFEFQQALGKIQNIYDDCPFECPKSKKKYDLKRFSYCQSCPIRRQRDIFETQTEEYVLVKLGDIAKRYPFAHLQTTVYQVGSLLDLSADKLSVKAGNLVSIYNAEQRRSKLDG